MPIPNDRCADDAIYYVRRWACAIRHVARPLNYTIFHNNALTAYVRHYIDSATLTNLPTLDTLLCYSGAIFHIDSDRGRRALRHNRRALFHGARNLIIELITRIVDQGGMSFDDAKRYLIEFMREIDARQEVPHLVRYTNAVFLSLNATTYDPNPTIDLIGVRCGLCNSELTEEGESDSCPLGGCVNCSSSTECVHCGTVSVDTQTLLRLRAWGHPYVPTMLPAQFTDERLPLFTCCTPPTVQCDICGEIYHLPHTSYSGRCPNTTYCEPCDEYTHFDDTQHCVECGCLRFRCPVCDDVFHVQDDHQYFYDNGAPMCEHCWTELHDTQSCDEDDEDVVTYTAAPLIIKPSDKFDPIKLRRPITFGLEIECGLPQSDRVALSQQGWKITSDNSVKIPNAVEMVSPILTGETLPEALESARKYFNNGTVNATCGFHLHLGVKNIYSWFEIYKIMLYAKLFEDTFYATQPPSRQENRYAVRLRVPSGIRTKEQFYLSLYTTAHIARLSIKAKYPITGARINRYAWLNFQAYLRYGTLENRLHSGTTNVDKMYHWAAFNAAWLEHAANTHPSRWESPLCICPPATRDYMLARIKHHNGGEIPEPYESARNLFEGRSPHKIAETLETKKGTVQCAVSLAW